jgi:hypothetical protein
MGTEIPTLFYKTVEDEWQSLRIGREQFSPWNIIPLSTTLTLFSQSTGAEGETVYNPVTTWTLPAGEEPTRLILHRDIEGNPQVHFFTEEHDAHKPLHIRAINLTNREVAVSLGPVNEILPPQADRVFPRVFAVNEQQRFGFQYAAFRSTGRTTVSPRLNLRFRRARQRMTLIFSYFPEYEGSGPNRRLLGMTVTAVRLYDLVPLPPPTDAEE